MYKKAVSVLVLGSFLFLVCCLCIRELDEKKITTEPVAVLKLELEQLEKKARTQHEKEKVVGIATIAVSGERVVECAHLEQNYIYDLTDEELEVLLRIVEAEAGCEDEEGKLLVANVVLNRVADEAFPDTVTEVVFQQENGIFQFSPIADGRYYQVKISKSTIQAVSRALLGEDISEGALFFAARARADADRMKWFDEKLTFLFVHGRHEFFK